MTKRFILTIVLITIFWMIYTMFIFTPPETKPKKAVDDTAPQKTEVTAKLDYIEESNPVVVITPLYKAEFSRRGGYLISFKLKTHKDWMGNDLELVPKGRGLFGLRIGDLNTDSIEFIPSEDTIIVEDYKTAQLTMTADSPKVTKEFGFDRESYLIDFSYSVDSGNVTLLFNSGLATTEKNIKDDLGNFEFINYGKGIRKIPLKKLQKKKDGIEYVKSIEDVIWIGLKSKYFFLALIPENNTLKGAYITYTKGTERNYLGFSALSGHQGNYRVYIGPIDYYLLRDMGMGLASVYSFGWKLIAPFSRLVLWLFKTINGFVHNYGYVIIVFAIIMKIIFWPLNIKSVRSMRKMQELKPKMDALRKIYKDDPQRMQKELLSLYKEHKVNPFSGCVMMLPQLPIFYALYQVLRTSIEFRNAPFILWITDLSVKDPYYILPIVMGLASLLQMSMQPSQDKQSRMMSMFMPIIFTIIFLNFPAGIVLYWLIYSVLGVLEQAWIRKF